MAIKTRSMLHHVAPESFKKQLILQASADREFNESLKCAGSFDALCHRLNVVMYLKNRDVLREYDAKLGMESNRKFGFILADGTAFADNGFGEFARVDIVQSMTWYFSGLDNQI